MGISKIFGLNCSEISGRQLNPRKKIFEHLRKTEIKLKLYNNIIF